MAAPDPQTVDALVRNHCIMNISYLVQTLLATYRYQSDKAIDQLLFVRPLPEDYVTTAQAAGCVFVPDMAKQRYAVIREGTLVLPTETSLFDAAQKACAALNLLLPQRVPSQYWVVSNLLANSLHRVGGTLVAAGTAPATPLVWVKEAPGDPRDDPLIAQIAIDLSGAQQETPQLPPPLPSSDLPRIAMRGRSPAANNSVAATR
jgi:hypothetical protein